MGAISSVPATPYQLVIVPGDELETISFAAHDLLAHIEGAILKRGHAYIALSGGSTPQAIFKACLTDPLFTKIDWRKVDLFWGDERAVPPSDKESNYYNAMHAAFEQVPLPREQIHRMIAESNLEENALSYEKLLQTTLPEGRFDFVMLGVGGDGHTASLFPETEALLEKKRWVVGNLVPQLNTSRMTFTFPCLEAARVITFYAIGSSKRAILSEIFSSPRGSFPAQCLGTELRPARWIIDWAASQSLPFITGDE